MELAYLAPVHLIGKLVVLSIVAYSLYVLLRLWVVLVTLQGETEGGYVERASKTIDAIRNLEQADWMTVLQTLHDQELAKLNFARSAPNMLLLIGLLGTVFGLAETVGSLVNPFSNAVNKADPQEVFSLLSLTLRQMGTAFSCTIWGIAAALVVSVAVRFTAGKLSSVLSGYDLYILQNVVPEVLPKHQAAQIQNLQELVSKSQEIVAESRKFLQQIAPVMREAAEQFEKVLTTAGEAMQQSVDKLTQTAQAMQEKLQYVAQGVTQSASALENSSEKLRDSTAALAEYHTDLRNAHQELLTVFEQARSDLENQIKGQLEKIGALDENFRHHAQDIVARINDAGRQFGEATVTFREAGERFTNEGVQIHSQITTYHQQLTEYVENLLKDHRFAIDEVEKSVSAIRDSLYAIKESPVWQLKNGSDGKWDRVEEVLNAIWQVLGEMKERLPHRLEIREKPEIVAHVPDRGRPLLGTVRDERPLSSSSTDTTSAVDNQVVVVLESALKDLSAAISKLEDSMSRREHIALSVPGMQELPQNIVSLRMTMEDLRDAVLELSGLLKTLQPQPLKRRRWFSWLLIWRRGK